MRLSLKACLTLWLVVELANEVNAQKEKRKRMNMADVKNIGKGLVKTALDQNIEHADVKKKKSRHQKQHQENEQDPHRNRDSDSEDDAEVEKVSSAKYPSHIKSSSKGKSYKKPKATS